MVMFTSDGASVMLGKLSGVAAQLKRDIPHLVQQHCIAHREDLGISDAWKEVKLIRDIKTLMRTVYTVFCWSSRRKCKFQEIVDASEWESVAFKALNEVCWLTRHFSLQAIIHNYNPLLEYFEQDKDTDPVSKYCHKKLNTMEYQITLDILNDVLLELASLSTLFQKRGLTPLEAFHLAQDRFPEDEVQEWSAFDCAAIVKCDFNFGIQQVKSLCSKYKDFLAEEIVINEQFQDLAKLMDIGGTFLAPTANWERGFGLMNTLKNKLRNRLQVDHLDMLSCIKRYQLDGGLIDLDRVYIEWAKEKDRREKQ
ncbi:unnamed protein product [Caretta caretta]